MAPTGLHVVLATTRDRISNGLAIAEELAKLMPTARITFAGPAERPAMRQVEHSGYAYCGIVADETASRRWSFSDRWSSERAAKRMLRRSGSAIVIGLGGPATDSMAKAAVAQDTPLVLYEFLVDASASTRKFATRASLICLAHEATRRQLTASCPMRVTGTPVPASFAAVPRRADGWPRTKRMVVVCDDTVHDPLNLLVVRALHKVRDSLDEWKVCHQTGTRDLASVREQYHKHGLMAAATSRVSNLAAAVTCADLVISRASTPTLACLAAAGAPTIVVPRNGDDAPNRDAELFRLAGACRVVEEDGAWMGDQLAAELSDLLLDDNQRQDLSECIARQARADAGWNVATMVRDLAIAAGCRVAA